MKTITKIYRINATLAKVWEAFVSPDMINEWGGGPRAIMGDKVGDRFSLWDGEIWGTNIQVEERRRLRQEWFASKEWKLPSIVTIELDNPGGGETLVKVTHEKLPENLDEASFKSFDDGWDKYYMEPLIRLVEEGS